VTTSLARSLAAGDPEAFATLYDRLATRLVSTARTMTGSIADAEDVVHDLFVDLARGRSRLAAVADLDAYIFTMLRHAVGKRRRRSAIDRKAVSRIAVEQHKTDGLVTTPEHDGDDALAAAIATLPAAQREVVALKIDGGLTFAEIAAVIGTTANTAASRYRYALEKLRSHLTARKTHR
jgi:RNA polymerase sigma-70 factor (ECF subfamily)